MTVQEFLSISRNNQIQTGPELSFSRFIQETDLAQMLNLILLMHKINADYKN